MAAIEHLEAQVVLRARDVAADGPRRDAGLARRHGERVEDPEAIDGALGRALRANEDGIPAVLDFVVAKERLEGSVEFFKR